MRGKKDTTTRSPIRQKPGASFPALRKNIETRASNSGARDDDDHRQQRKTDLLLAKASAGTIQDNRSRRQQRDHDDGRLHCKVFHLWRPLHREQRGQTHDPEII